MLFKFYCFLVKIVKGVGTFAMKTLETFATTKGIKLISEEDAIGFYKKLVYTQISDNNFIKNLI